MRIGKPPRTSVAGPEHRAPNNEDCFVTKCEDLDGGPRSMDNVGRKVQAQISVNSTVSACIDSLTTVIDYRFLQ